jgi:membrane-bound serine protease (ClpP class)
MLVFCRSLRLLGLTVFTTVMALTWSRAAAEPPVTESPSLAGKSGSAVKVVVIPVQDEIAKPVLYILRRGLKEAIEMKADVVVLDMKTPGGALDVTFEIMEALGKFPGRTITYVNTEAISAGAFISATTGDIWFAPEGVIGAAAPVLATGGEIDASMKQKIVSYLRARVRAISEGKPYRGEVISAMIDADFELKIGDKVIKPKGELLSLTAKEASASYGDPPQPLLAAGIAENLEDLLYKKLGATPESTRHLKITGAEKAAVLLNSVRTILLGLGLLAAFIEFKTPGFGVFGISAAILLAAVFFGHYIAGFSGHEPVLVFLLGVAAVVVELVFFPGVVILALAGIVLMLGSLVWSMADIWPNQPLEISGDLLLLPVANVGAGLLIAMVLAVLLARFLPRGWIWDRMVLTANVGQGHPPSQGFVSTGEAADKLVGAKGVAVTGLYPSGQVEVEGRRYEAHLALGSADPGARVIVTGRAGFSILVEKLDA